MQANKEQSQNELASIENCKLSLGLAVENCRSTQWRLRLWSRFIRTRDAFRCVCCGSKTGIQAHHIIRKTLLPACAFDLGNGITLCRECHMRIHAQFNGKPDLSLPLGAEQGDDQDEWSFLFGLLKGDAIERGLQDEEFYHFGDAFMEFTVACQGYQELYEIAKCNGADRLRYAHEVWRMMPEGFYSNVISELVRRNFRAFD